MIKDKLQKFFTVEKDAKGKPTHLSLKESEKIVFGFNIKTRDFTETERVAMQAQAKDLETKGNPEKAAKIILSMNYPKKELEIVL